MHVGWTQAQLADPLCVLAHVAACVSKGRLALLVDNRQKVALAKDSREDACTALACDQCSDLAHHLLGRFQYEMAQVCHESALVPTDCPSCVFILDLLPEAFSPYAHASSPGLKTCAKTAISLGACLLHSGKR